MSLKLAFMGTPDFSVPILAALIAAGHDVAAVYSQPPRPAGRGQKFRESPVHAFAARQGIPVFTPKSLKGIPEQEAFAALKLDVAVVAAYGLILPKPVLDAPRLGCVNVHASLLPRWRGAAPIQRAILAGDVFSGVTIMQMEEGLDTGPMLAVREIAIGPAMTTGELHDRLAAEGALLLTATLAGIEAGRVAAIPQPAEGVTYAAKIAKEEAELDWSRTAVELDRIVRAFAPQPGAWFAHGGERFKVLAARPVPGRPGTTPGTLLDEALLIACGEGTALRALRLQRAGKGAMEARDFLRGFPLAAGTLLCPASS